MKLRRERTFGAIRPRYALEISASKHVWGLGFDIGAERGISGWLPWLQLRLGPLLIELYAWR